MNETGERKEGGTDRRPSRWAAGFVVIVIAALVMTAGLRSARNLESARRQATSLESRIDQTRLRIEALEARLARLDDDPATLERLAREELGMVRPGDVVIVLPAEEDEADRARLP